MDLLGILYLICVVFLHHSALVWGHGRLMDPPSRASMWRYGYNTEPNYSDNQMFCGGFQYQKNLGGLCGICGDPYNGAREHEAGGKYASGLIVRQYNMGQTISVTWQLTANHRGWVEFKICPNNDVTTPATQECLDQNLLTQADGTSRFMIPASVTGLYTRELQLPAGLTCSQCVLQWRYHAGNSWGTDPDGTSCVGCGPQEEFYACADVMIGQNIQQVTDPVAQPTIPDGNDPDMDDYVDWEWDTVPEGYSTTGQSTMSNGVTDSSSQLGCALAVLWLCVLLSVNLI